MQRCSCTREHFQCAISDKHIDDANSGVLTLLRPLTSPASNMIIGSFLLASPLARPDGTSGSALNIKAIDYRRSLPT